MELSPLKLSLSRFRGSFASKIVTSLCLVTAGDFLFFQGEYFGGTFGLFGLLLLAGMAFAMPIMMRDRRSTFALVLAALFAISMIYDASLLAFAMFWTAAICALLLPRSKVGDDGWQWFQRLLFHGSFALIAPLTDTLRWMKARQNRGFKVQLIRRVVPLVFLPVVGTIIFLLLFASANPVISDWLSSVDLLNIDALDIARIFFWGVLGWLIWMVMRPHIPRVVLGTFEGRGDTNIPGVSLGSVMLSLIMFNAVFLLQNAMDAAWLWAGVSLPEEFTLAQYAHRGAYPLIATALLAGAFVLIALRPGSTTASSPNIRLLVGLWVAQNVFLVFNASLRTLNYINAYSLTEMRIAALFWMALVALGLVLILWRMLSDKSTSWLINSNAAALALVLGITCFVDLGSVAAQWNVRHARQVDGDGAVLDLCYLNRLGGSALLPLIELESRDLPPKLKERVRNVRMEVYSQHNWQIQVHGKSWDILGVWRLQQAEQLLGEAPKSYERYHSHSCDGTPHAPPPPPAPPLPHMPENNAEIEADPGADTQPSEDAMEDHADSPVTITPAARPAARSSDEPVIPYPASRGSSSLTEEPDE